MVGVKGRSGRRIEYNDIYHKATREQQRKYDAEISKIREEHGWCSYEEARRIRLEQKRKAKK